MPSSMTHAYFSRDVYDKINTKQKENINIDKLKIFAQGPDIYYFYNLLIGKKNKFSYNIGSTIHEQKINEYFYNLITYIKNNDLYNNEEIKSFLYGSICHYVLDSTIHPYIIYKTGIFNKMKKNTYKYNGLHPEMEYYLDIYMIFQNEKMEGKNYKIYKELFKYTTISKDLENLINYIVIETYNINDASLYYSKSLKDIKNFFKYFNYDPIGIKKVFYSIIDLMTPKKIMKVKELSFNVNHNKKRHYLNLEKSTWNHPFSLEETYNYSFIELYVIATHKAINIINKIDSLMDKKEIKKEDINDIFNDISYLTGKDYKLDKNLKYFEF